jgi:co-chaperonin GroES (HSP10)
MVMVSSALRKALQELQEQDMLDPADLPFKVMFWRLVVEPMKPRAESDGGIVLPDEVQDADRIRTSVGRVLQVGSMAFKARTQAGLLLSDEPNIPKVGDYVLHERYAGQEIDLRNGRSVRVLMDTEVLMLVTDPEKIKHYI